MIMVHFTKLKRRRNSQGDTMSDNDFDPNPTSTIRRLWPTDMDAYRTHLKRLDPDSRHARFGGGVSDQHIDTHVDSSLRMDTLLFGAFDKSSLIGVGELRLLFGEWPMAAEAAFSVERIYQDHGLGDALMARVMAAARNRGITRLSMICLSHNERMRHLAHKHHAEFVTNDGETEVWIPSGSAIASTIIEETFGETGGLFNGIFQWTRMKMA